MYCRCNPDEEMRRAERSAQDDPEARYKLLHLRARAGDLNALIEVFQLDLLDRLNTWANRDGRSVIRGHHRVQLPHEHPFERIFSWSNSIWFDEEANLYRLLWEAHIQYDPEILAKLQAAIKDIRLLRPINEVKVVLNLSTVASDSPFSNLPTNISGVFLENLSCDWNPELIKAGDSWHSGWYAYRGEIPDSHPYLELIELVQNSIADERINYGHLHRQEGPRNRLTQTSPVLFWLNIADYYNRGEE